MTARPRSPCFPATCRRSPEARFEDGTPVDLNFLRFTAAAEARAQRRGRRGPAAYPLRPRARFPDRRLAQMKRPTAIPLDQDKGRRDRSRARPAPSPRPKSPSCRRPSNSSPIRHPSPRPCRSRRRRTSWLVRLLWTTAGLLVSLGLGLAADALIRDLFATNPGSAGSASPSSCSSSSPRSSSSPARSARSGACARSTTSSRRRRRPRFRPAKGRPGRSSPNSRTSTRPAPTSPAPGHAQGQRGAVLRRRRARSR